MPNIDLSPKSTQTYSILRAALTSLKPFTQIDLSRTACASPSQTSRVLRWMIEHGHAERLPDGLYRIRNPAGLVSSAMPYQRSMKDALCDTARLRGKKADIKEALIQAGGILCLESALEEYSQFFRADRICIYHERPEELVKTLGAEEGGIMQVSIFLPDLPLEGDVEKKRQTSKFRTVVDLACDGRIYTAKDLIEELWGVRID